MKNYFTFLILLIASILIISCNKDDNMDDGNNNPEQNIGDFGELKKGDKLLYTFLIGENFFDPNNINFEYTGDTLQITILDIIDGKYLIEELILPNSTVFTEDKNYIDKSKVANSIWANVNDSLEIIPYNSSEIQSHLLWDGYLPHKSPLTLSNDKEIKFSGWKPEGVDYSNQIGYLQDFELLGHEYNTLNVHISTLAFAFDGDGYCMVYNEQAGIVRTQLYSAWTGIGFGWDFLGKR